MNYLRLLQLRRMAAMMAPDAGGSAPAGGANGADAGGSDAQTDGTNAGEETDGTAGEANQTGDRTFTQADVNRIIQREQAKWKRQQDKAVSEAERLASMTAEQREAERARQREADLTRREADLNRRELRAQALNTLAERSYPAELADLLDYTDADSCSASIDRVGKAWQKAVQKGVEARVSGSAPKAGSGKGKAPMTMREAITAHYKK